MTYDQYAPGLRYGYDLANNDTYRNKRWSDIEAICPARLGNTQPRHGLGQGQGCRTALLGSSNGPAVIGQC